MKPRLKKAVLDSIFKNLYKTFQDIFEGCDPDFQRDIFSNAHFRYYAQDTDKSEQDCFPDWMMDKDTPVIEEAGKIPKNIHFVLSG